MDRVDIQQKGGSAIRVKSSKKQSKKRPVGEPIEYEILPENDSQNACKQVWLGRFFSNPRWVGRQSITDPTVSIGPLADALSLDHATLRAMVAQVRQEHPKANEKMTGEVHNCRVTELYYVLKKLGYNETRIIAMCAQIDPYYGETPEYHLQKYREERDGVKKIRDAKPAPVIVSAESSAHDSSSSDERKRRRVSDESAVEVANSNVAPATPAIPVIVVSNPASVPLVSDGPVPTPEQMAKLAADFASVYARFQAFQNGQ